MSCSASCGRVDGVSEERGLARCSLREEVIREREEACALSQEVVQRSRSAGGIGRARRLLTGFGGEWCGCSPCSEVMCRDRCMP